MASELHEHTNTVHGIKDPLLAQNWVVHVLAIKRLVAKESINHDVFPENVRAFARNYYNQKKLLLFQMECSVSSTLQNEGHCMSEHA